ncbi:MAG: ribulose phosphate epimerase [Deltaproteobacteria bacterium]|nr:ribulose phosphate epimerase [Deltaproteobacteria bacterium]
MLDYDLYAPGVGGGSVDVPAFGGFIPEPDGGFGPECDIFAQDCPAGEKCMPWANDGGSAWNSTRCSPIDPNPDQVGDVCSVDGSAVSGIDSCDLGAMCFFVDNATNEGVCVEMCGCTEQNPVCTDPSTVCSISNGGVLALCREVCNPLDPLACPAGAGCYPTGSFFQCSPDASGNLGAPGEPCQFLNACDPGSVCLGSDLIPGCPAGSAGCCTSMCDPLDGNGACLAGQDCVPWYEPGSAPDACLGGVGTCIIPQ